MKPCRTCGCTERYPSGNCIPCGKKASAKWRNSNPEKHYANFIKFAKNNPDKIKENGSRYYINNREKIYAKKKEWNAKNKEKLKIYRQKIIDKTKVRASIYRLNNKDKIKEQHKNWELKNKDKRNAITSKRRVIKLNAIPKWFGELDKFIIKEAHTLCKLREIATNIKWHTDHQVPLISKLVCGFHVGCNIQVISAKQNFIKGNRYWPDMP